MKNFPKIVAEAYARAIEVQKNSYSPYSHFSVGSCVKFVEDEGLYAGCNVENSSYGATICAERNAILQGIAIKGFRKIEFVVVVAQDAVPPCAMCLQVISEFSDENTKIYLGTPKNLEEPKFFKDYLPYNFTKKMLEESVAKNK